MKTQLWVARHRSLAPSVESLRPVLNQRIPWGKPVGGGLWTSTWDGHKSDWIRWCEREEFHSGPHWVGYLLEPSPDTRVFTIDSYPDLQDAIARYPYKGEPGKATWESRSHIDWEAIARDFDAVHLTLAGQAATRFAPVVLGPDLYGWDCESTLWFRWAFAGEPVRVEGSYILNEAVMQ